MWAGTRKAARRKPQASKRFSSAIKSAGTLTLNFPASRTVKEKCLLVSLPVCDTVFWQPEQLTEWPRVAQEEELSFDQSTEWTLGLLLGRKECLSRIQNEEK